MRHVRSFLFIVLLSFFASHSQAAEGRINKVLPQFLDLQGKNTLAPSLYERDAYQKMLRDFPHRRSAIRFTVQHSSPKKNQTLKLRVEMRGVKGQQLIPITKEVTVQKGGIFRTWSAIELSGDEYKKFGELSAWRATLWDGDKQLAEQKSFLW